MADHTCIGCPEGYRPECPVHGPLIVPTDADLLARAESLARELVAFDAAVDEVTNPDVESREDYEAGVNDAGLRLLRLLGREADRG